MVDSVSNWPPPSLLLAQIYNAKLEPQPQLKAPRQQSYAMQTALPQKNLLRENGTLQNVLQTQGSATAQNLPRGSLIDIIV
ncbi:MAG: hypothetical protein FWF24_06275 [Alphaproteobacteria bacterium]|nr:hypothetical protein [Alphaproteobacteria bacterium]